MSTPPQHVRPSHQPPTETQRLFRDLLKKVGSGTHTAKSLSREESAIATEIMLSETATPAQIGAFMIAQRIKRPTPTELAGMLDTYDAMGPMLSPVDSEYPVTVFSNPYDGRSRTAPINPLTSLILAAAGCPVILHGSGRVPTKYGLPTIEILEGLGLEWRQLKTLDQVQTMLEQTGFTFIHQAIHFPAAEAMVAYRDQIGKRPTLATVEIMWSPYKGKGHVVSGYVHPPTEGRTQQCFTERGTEFFTTVKGLEGSCDIARSRTAIISLNQLESGQLSAERLLVHPRDYGFEGTDPELEGLDALLTDYQATLTGQQSEVGHSAIWNSGFYLWRVGRVASIEEGFTWARSHLENGKVKNKLEQIKEALASA
ncbi:MAG: anthranilate phosphoribosyltransferase family protein [Cyanobacteria bacterium J06573_11]